jgi:6-phosphogluconolactonase
VQHTGSSVNPKRQGEPHAHCVKLSPDNRFALVADLGLDKVLIYRFDPKAGTIVASEPPFAALDGGAGPRHFAFHPNGRVLYVINELNSTVSRFNWDAKAGRAETVDSVTTLPSGHSGENSTAEIVVHPNGKWLFGSNRGHNSIAVFAIDGADGKLILVDHVPGGGEWPRNFALTPDGGYMLVANQRTDNVVVFRFNADSGKTTPTGDVLNVGSPVCVRFAAAG